MTGKWAEGEDAEELLKLDAEDEDDVYGDFEGIMTYLSMSRYFVYIKIFLSMSRYFFFV